MSYDHTWRDNPLTKSEQDRFGMGHISRRSAQLIIDTHTPNSSTVVGLIGPWGSGKSSVIAMCCEELKRRRPEWAIGRFTPWATSDVTSMLADFYTTLSETLPKQTSKELRKSLGRLASVGSPILRSVPGVGVAAAGLMEKAAAKILEQPSWDKAFSDVSTRLIKANLAVLIVVDDVDRLHGDELTDLLKVIRLLGRFPGVTYLMAYDEQTIFNNLEQAGVGDGDSKAARLFMEKIVQYPLAIPPLISEEVLQHLSDGLDAMLVHLERSINTTETRLSAVNDVYVSQLRTPRAIHRFLAQTQLMLSLHDQGEIDDVDVILMTLLRIQFPDLYAELPRWKSELTGSKSARRTMRDLQNRKSERPVDFEPLMHKIPDGHDRDDARELLEALFPACSKYTHRASTPQSVRNIDYFDRYFVHTVPTSDITDGAIRRALRQAGAAGRGHALMKALLTRWSPARSDLAVRRLWSASEELMRELDLLALLGSVMVLWPQVPSRTGAFIDTRDRMTAWAASLLRLIPADVAPGDVVASLSRCGDAAGPLNVVWECAGQGELQEPGVSASRMLADRSLDTVIAHLHKGDDAPVETPARFLFMFVARFGDMETAINEVSAAINEGVNVETLASRFVTKQHLVGVPNPAEQLAEFDQDTFAQFAPANDPLYEAQSAADLVSYDLSWSNRRAYTRGRARAPGASNTAASR